MSRADLDEARAAQLEAFLARMSKEKPGEVRTLADETVAKVDVIPTGVISLDAALGAGGLPRGRIIELYGPEGSGKTTLALCVAAQAQRLGLGGVGFIDAEHSLSRELAAAVGVDVGSLVLYQPDSGEDAVAMVEEMVKSGGFAVVIVDSVAAMTPVMELDASVDGQQMGAHARLMSKFMRRVAGPVADTGTMLILVNQVRHNLAAYGTPEQSTGGRAIKFYASVRIEVRSSASKRIERDRQVVGQTCAAKVVKNKVGPPHRVAEFDLIYGQGIESEGALLSVAEQAGVVSRAGAVYSFGDRRLGVGKDAVRELLRSDPALASKIEAETRARLGL